MQTHPLDNPNDGDDVVDNALVLTPHLSSSESSNELEDEILEPTFWYHNAGNALLWAMPLMAALCDTAVMAMAVRDMDENDSSSPQIILYLVAISLFQFMQSMALSGKSTVDSFKETTSIIRRRQLPQNEDWPILSSKREKIAIGITALVAPFPVSFDFANAFYFVKKIPDDYGFKHAVNSSLWGTFSASTGAFVSFTTLFTECFAMYKVARLKLSNQVADYRHPNLRTLAKILGVPLAVLGALESSIEAFATGKSLLNPEKVDKQYLLLTAAIIRAITDLCFSGKISIDGIYALFEKFAQGIPKKREVIAFLMALTTAVIVGAPMLSLVRALLKDPETSLPFQLPEWAILILASGVMLRDGTVQIFTVYPYAHKFTDAIITSTDAMIKKIQAMCGDEPAADLQRSLLTDFPSHHSIQNNLLLEERESPVNAYIPPQSSRVDVENPPPVLVSALQAQAPKLYKPTLFPTRSLQATQLPTPALASTYSMR